MLAVVTALKVPNAGLQGNGTFEVLCRQRTWRSAASSARSFAAQSGASRNFGGESELSPLPPLAMRSVVTHYEPVISGCVIGLRVIVSSYQGAPRPVYPGSPTDDGCLCQGTRGRPRWEQNRLGSGTWRVVIPLSPTARRAGQGRLEWGTRP